MKTFRYTLLALITTFGSFFASTGSAQDLKIGVVDMTRVFAEYYKTKDAEKQVNDGKAMAKKDLDERNARYKELIEQYQELVTAIKDPAISEELRAKIAGSIAMGRFGTSEECAPTFLFLASHATSGYITGQVIDINGGQICP